MNQRKQSGRITQLRPLLKKPAVLLLLAVELFFVASALAAALKPAVSYVFAPEEWEDVSSFSEIMTDAETGLRGVTEMTEGEDLLQTPPLTLPAGHYKITLDYRYLPSQMADGSLCHANLHFTAENMGVITGENALLDHNKTTDTVELNVRQSDNTIRLVAKNDSGIFQIGQATLRQDKAYAWACALGALLGALALNAVLLLLLPGSPLRLPGTLPAHLFVLAGAALLAAVPLLRDGGGMTGADWSFHVSRIEGIANALREGQFPVRLYSMAKDGYGYAPSLFYGELFLYFPAVLRLWGVSVQGAYHAFALAVQLGTALIAYFSFKKVVKNENAALVGAILYLLAPYRLTNFYMRAAVGEYLAQMLLPLIPAALALLYAETPSRRDRRGACALLVVAFGGLLQCHLITLELAVLATTIYCLWQWRKTFTRLRLIVWGRAAGLTVLLNLWFLLPLATMLVSGQYGGVYTSDVYRVQYQGLSLPDMLLWQKDNITVGLALWLGGALFVYTAFTAGARMPQRAAKAGWPALWIGTVAACMSLTLFPWAQVGQWPVVGPILVAIQFPWRYFSLASMLLSLVAAVALAALPALGRGGAARTAAAVCLVTATCSCGIFFGQYLAATTGTYYGGSATLQYASQKINNETYYFDSLYLPDEAKESRDGFETFQTVTTVTVGDISKEKGVTIASYAEETGTEGTLELPLLYYPGYKLVSGEGTLFKTANGMVGVAVPGGSSGIVQVAYREPLRWRMADAISLVALIAVAGVCLVRRRKSGTCTTPVKGV